MPPAAHAAVVARPAVPAPPSVLTRLVLQVSHYSGASLLGAAAGLVSFPVLTRLLPVADYGLLSLVSVTLGILCSVGKLGIQHAIIRYHSESASGRAPFDLRTLRATALLAMAGIGGAVTLLWLGASHIVTSLWLGDPRMPALFALTSVLILFAVL